MFLNVRIRSKDEKIGSKQLTFFFTILYSFLKRKRNKLNVVEFSDFIFYFKWSSHVEMISTILLGI